MCNNVPLEMTSRMKGSMKLIKRLCVVSAHVCRNHWKSYQPYEDMWRNNTRIYTINRYIIINIIHQIGLLPDKVIA